jgi:hypothetical protein
MQKLANSGTPAESAASLPKSALQNKLQKKQASHIKKQKEKKQGVRRNSIWMGKV